MSRWYIKLHRSSQDDPLYFAEPFTKWQAWQDLRLIANHADGFFFVRWNKVEVKRWRVARGENDLCHRWKWSRDKVRNFLKLLENMWKIIQQKNRICSIYIIVNYDDDQTTDQTTDPTTEKQQTLQQKNINNNNKKEKNEKEWLKILSKDNTPDGENWNEYWSKEINWIIEVMKQACTDAWLQYMPWYKERQFAKHILSKKLASEIEKYNMPLHEFIANIIKLSAQPYMKQVNTPQLFYQNRGHIINSWISSTKSSTTKISYI